MCKKCHDVTWVNVSTRLQVGFLSQGRSCDARPIPPSFLWRDWEPVSLSTPRHSTAGLWRRDGHRAWMPPPMPHGFWYQIFCDFVWCSAHLRPSYSLSSSHSILLHAAVPRLTWRVWCWSYAPKICRVFPRIWPKYRAYEILHWKSKWHFPYSLLCLSALFGWASDRIQKNTTSLSISGHVCTNSHIETTISKKTTKPGMVLRRIKLEKDHFSTKFWNLSFYRGCKGFFLVLLLAPIPLQKWPPNTLLASKNLPESCFSE